jgi:hypothetical protein
MPSATAGRRRGVPASSPESLPDGRRLGVGREDGGRGLLVLHHHPPFAELAGVAGDIDWTVARAAADVMKAMAPEGK